MFNKEEIEKQKAEIENLKSQLQVKTMELQLAQEQIDYKNNDLFDNATTAFNGFRRIVEIAERNDYGDPKQKVRQIREESEKLKQYFAQLTIKTPLKTKTKLSTTDQSNR